MAKLIDTLFVCVILINCIYLNNCQDSCNTLGDVTASSITECLSACIGMLQNLPDESRRNGVRALFNDDTCHVYENGLHNMAPITSGITCLESSRRYAEMGCDKTYDGNGEDASGSAWASNREGVGAWIQINLPSRTEIKRMKFILRKDERDHPKDMSITFDGSTVENHTFQNYKGITVPGPTESVDFDPPHYATQIKIDFLSMYYSPHNNIGFAEIMICAGRN